MIDPSEKLSKLFSCGQTKKNPNNRGAQTANTITAALITTTAAANPGGEGESERQEGRQTTCWADRQVDKETDRL